ncbi:MAG TPA: hypothetical protein VGQ57_07255, partial [Polyangiaceae bacterium]|nr:hypothetical protein [Polyangiaceae bacterium]
MRTLLATVGALAVAGFGCSDADKGGGDLPAGSGGKPALGSGGSGVVASGGKASTGGQGATGGSAPAAGAPGAGGSGGSGGGTAGIGSGGTGTDTGGTGTGGRGMASGGRVGMGTGGAPTAGGNAGGAHDEGGSANAGTGTSGAGAGGAAAGGTNTGGRGGKAGGGGSGGGSTGTCTASQGSGKSVTGTGPHKVVIETNSASGIKCGTIYRPQDLGGTEKYPIFVWGEGGCSQDGLSNQAAMGEIASWGYFVVADGTPGSSGACAGGQDGKAMLDYITWAIAENDKSCSAYYQSLEPTKIAADGFSCGGLMSENVSGDPRFTAIGITSSGLMSANASLYDKIHTPFKIMNGGSSDIAHDNGARDYDEISSRKVPIVYFSKSSAGHGGDLGQARGDFNLVNLAWLNWQLKGDEGATGKGFLIGSTCKFCMASGWD